MAVSCTNSAMDTFNTITTLTFNAATADTADLAEEFTITPTRSDEKVIIIIKNGHATTALTFSVAPGGLWAAAPSALTGSVAGATERAIVLEGGKYKSSSKDTGGTYVVTLTPGSGLKLKTNHSAAIAVLELPH